MTTARAYLRVSTARQEQGASLTTQREAIATYARQHDLTLVHEYVDILSGSRDDRPRYKQMLIDLAPSEVVLVWRLDRIGRKKSELFRFFEWCKQHRIGLISVTQPEMSNELARDIMSVLAAYESQQIAERVLPGMATRVEQGKWVSKPPYYYRIGPDHTLIPAENAGDAQKVWDAVLATGSIERAAAMYGLNTLNLRVMLKCRTYLGETVWNGIVMPNTHPAIVSRETWEAVDALRNARKTQKRRERRDTALLTGFIYVADTDQRLYSYTRLRRTEGINRYYVTKAGNHTPYHSIRADDADQAVIDGLIGLSVNQAQLREIESEERESSRDDPHKRERASLRRKIAALDTERIETARMEAQRRITSIEADRMHAQQDRERAGHVARLDTLPPPWDAAAVASMRARLDLAARIEYAQAKGDVVTLRLLVEAFIARVEVWGGEGGRGYRWLPPREVRIVWGKNVRIGPTLSH